MPAITQGENADKSTERLDAIDALRGTACLWVMLLHTFHDLPLRGGLIHLPYSFVVAVAHLGGLGVHLFLVLSGFCLSLPFVRQSEATEGRPDWKRFALKRAKRILPAYYAALLLFSILEHFPPYHDLLSPPHGGLDYAMHLLMLHNLSLRTVTTINGSFWSLALECQLYLLLPVLVGLAHRYGLRRTLGLTLVIAVAWQTDVLFHYGLHPAWRQAAVLNYALPGRCFEFAAGMAAARFTARPIPGQTGRAGALLAFLLLPGLFFEWRGWEFAPFCDQIWGTIFACLILVCLRRDDSSQRSLSLHGALARLGTFSYSVYLIHQPFLRLLSPNRLHLHLDGAEISLAYGLVSLAAVIMLGYGFHLIAERPFLRPTQAPRPVEDIRLKRAA